MTPLVKLLRLMDGDAAAMGKVYTRMLDIGTGLDKCGAAWKDKVVEIHKKRSKYLHSEMHAAGSILDPEFMTTGAYDETTQDGLIAVIERVSLRDEMAAGIFLYFFLTYYIMTFYFSVYH
jgi:hypothetical protein